MSTSRLEDSSSWPADEYGRKGSRVPILECRRSAFSQDYSCRSSEHRTYKLGSGVTSEYGSHVKSLGGAVTGLAPQENLPNDCTKESNPKEELQKEADA